MARAFVYVSFFVAIFMCISHRVYSNDFTRNTRELTNSKTYQLFLENSGSKPELDRGLLPGPHQTNTAGATDQAFGSWKIVCSDASQCRLAQSIVVGPDGNRRTILVARAYRRPSPMLVLTAPAGIYLAPGLALKIGSGKSRRYPFETCSADGCHTGLKLDTALLKDLASGKTGKVSFFDATQTVVTAVLSLEGFKAGYEVLGRDQNSP